VKDVSGGQTRPFVSGEGPASLKFLGPLIDAYTVWSRATKFGTVEGNTLLSTCGRRSVFLEVRHASYLKGRWASVPHILGPILTPILFDLQRPNSARLHVGEGRISSGQTRLLSKRAKASVHKKFGTSLQARTQHEEQQPNFAR